MKRRELLSKAFYLGVSLAIPTAKGASIITSKVISKVYPYKPDQSVYILSNNPELYTTIETVVVQEDQVPFKIVTQNDVINNGEKEIELTKAGKYSFQYLGPSYGWLLT